MHDGEGTTGAWQREGTAGTRDGERTSGAWQEGGHVCLGMFIRAVLAYADTGVSASSQLAAHQSASL